LEEFQMIRIVVPLFAVAYTALVIFAITLLARIGHVI
jgi:hypothetical protein